ncbi:MAG: phosphoglycerate dehydrogenase [Verrucomicrobiia bacterium]
MSAAKSRILILDHVSPRGVEVLTSEPSFEVVVKPPLKEPELVAEIVGFDALVVRSQTKVGRAAIAAAPRLKVIGRAGVGVDNVDVDAATERGVIVMNTPSGNTISTAEHAFSLMLSMARSIPQAHASMREGKWDRKSFTGVELYNKTLGVIGLGRIGSEFARRAIAFGMRVLAHDPFTSLSRARSLQVEMVDLDDLFTRADIITVHMPLSERTKNMVGRDAFAKMKKGVRIINCARGGIVDEKALADALGEGKVAAAALDVYEQEPPPADHPLRAFPQVVMTPHLGASTHEAQEGVGIEIAEAIRTFLLKGEVQNAVNVPNVDSKTLAVIRPYLRLAERLGRGVSQLAPDRVEELTVSYCGAVSEVNTQPVTRLVVKGFLERISGRDVNPVNAMVTASGLGIRITENRTVALGSYTDLIQVSARRGSETASMTATFFGSVENPRIVRINDRTVEAAPEGVILLFANEDCPGIIGRIGTILGRHKINIASMTLSREKLGGPAVTALNLDTEPPAEVIKEIATHPDMHWAKVVKL